MALSKPQPPPPEAAPITLAKAQTLELLKTQSTPMHLAVIAWANDGLPWPTILKKVQEYARS